MGGGAEQSGAAAAVGGGGGGNGDANLLAQSSTGHNAFLPVRTRRWALTKGGAGGVHPQCPPAAPLLPRLLHKQPCAAAKARRRHGSSRRGGTGEVLQATRGL